MWKTLTSRVLKQRARHMVFRWFCQMGCHPVCAMCVNQAPITLDGPIFLFHSSQTFHRRFFYQLHQIPATMPSLRNFAFSFEWSDLAGEPLVTEFRISSRWTLADPTDHIKEGAKRVCQHFRSRPHSVLEMESEGRRLLLGTWSLEVFTFASPIFLAPATAKFDCVLSATCLCRAASRQSSGAICEGPASCDR